MSLLNTIWLDGGLKDTIMRTLSLEELLEAGCHFGHQVTRQNPKSRDFVFEARDNIHIIDLEKTKEGLELAAAAIKKVASQPGSTLLMLGSKRQAATVVKEEVTRAHDAGIFDVYSVTNRWIGGTLTNLAEVAKNYKRLKDLEKKLQDKYERAKYTKREILLWEREKQKLESFYGGIVNMPGLPSIIFIVDTHHEKLAVREAISTRVPVAGIVDTNADPDMVDYVVPANDDAVGSIKLIVNYIVDAWIEGKKQGAEEVANSQEQNVKSEEKKEKAETTLKEEVKEKAATSEKPKAEKKTTAVETTKESKVKSEKKIKSSKEQSA
jgi:small subunit ribosomal protein S2